MKTTVLMMALVLLVSCAAGPTFIAKNEAESIKTNYDDPGLRNLATKHRGLLGDIYNRYTKDRISFYPDGIGFTALKDERMKPHSYLMVHVRPDDVYFDQNTTKAEQRFSAVINKSFQRYLTYIKVEDMDSPDVNGVAFGLYWSVRDYAKCDSYGGYIEYAIAYIHKQDYAQFKNGNKTLRELLEASTMQASFNREQPKKITPVF